jgi:hypothetical protein
MNIRQMLLNKTPMFNNWAEIEMFIGIDQLEDDVEDDQVFSVLARLSDILGFMPDSSHINPQAEQQYPDQQGTSIAYLHYTIGRRDYYITNRDHGSRQWRAFGMIDTGGLHGQMDFVCIRELLRAGALLDLDWQPRPLSSVKTRNCDF